MRDSLQGGRWVEDPWRDNESYCTKCGRKTVLLTREARGYGPDFGERNMEYMIRCPDKKGLLDGHYKQGWAKLVYLPPLPSTPSPRG